MTSPVEPSPVAVPDRPASAPRGRRIAAQARLELLLTLRRGESVLLTFLIPLLLLVFFSSVDVLPSEPGVEDPVDFLAPGILALAVMSSALVSLAIATGFERAQGVLKRLGASPLTRGDLVAAKLVSIAVLEALQVVLLSLVGIALGWRPSAGALAAAVAALALATVAFAGLGLLLSGTLPSLTTLAAANGVYLLLLLVGGMVIPLSSLPDPVAAVARATPAGALSEAVHGAFDGGAPGWTWLVLGAWAVVTPLLAARFFRWEGEEGR